MRDVQTEILRRIISGSPLLIRYSLNGRLHMKYTTFVREARICIGSYELWSTQDGLPAAALRLCNIPVFNVGIKFCYFNLYILHNKLYSAQRYIIKFVQIVVD